jgi:[ribosomal protein S5]-alanine N-acetyltransferase
LFKFPELDGKRVKLIHLDDKWLDDMFEYSSNPLLYKYFEFEPQKTFIESKNYLTRLKERNNVDTAHYWFILFKNENKVIGSFGIHDIDWRKKDGELSYGISPEYWGKGIFQEILQIVLEFLYKIRGFHRLIATTREDNYPSIKGLEKIGFIKEATLRDYYLSYDGSRYNAVIMSILNNEFKKFKSP